MKPKLRFFLLVGALFSTSCALLGDDTPPPLRVDQMQVDYTRWGGWGKTIRLVILPSGEVQVADGAREPLVSGAFTPDVAQRERLAALLAWFPTYRRHYEPSTEVADANGYEIVLHYRGTVDTVGVYGFLEHMPGSLVLAIQEMESLYEQIRAHE